MHEINNSADTSSALSVNSFVSRNHHLLAGADSMGSAKEARDAGCSLEAGDGVFVGYASARRAFEIERLERDIASYELEAACGACVLKEVCKLTEDRAGMLRLLEDGFLRRRFRNRISKPDGSTDTAANRVPTSNNQLCATNLFADRVQHDA